MRYNISEKKLRSLIKECITFGKCDGWYADEYEDKQIKKLNRYKVLKNERDNV